MTGLLMLANYVQPNYHTLEDPRIPRVQCQWPTILDWNTRHVPAPCLIAFNNNNAQSPDTAVIVGSVGGRQQSLTAYITPVMMSHDKWIACTTKAAAWLNSFAYNVWLCNSTGSPKHKPEQLICMICDNCGNVTNQCNSHINVISPGMLSRLLTSLFQLASCAIVKLVYRQ